jgi:UbiD family decarboxylase
MGLLRQVDNANWNLEIGAITDLNAKRNKYTLLFDNITDYPRGFRILTGAALDSKRVALSLGMSPSLDNMALVRELRSKLSTAEAEFSKYDPKFVSSAPFKENIDEGDKIDFLKFPSPKWFDHDGGRYIGTSDAVITKDPDSGWVNVGTYRVMVSDRNTLCILLESSRHGRHQMQKYFDRGKPAPVVISFGHHPALSLLAGIEAPAGVSEFNYLGTISGQPYEVVEGPVTGLPIPADSEIALEGYIINEPRSEGPLGEFVGYYTGGVFQAPIIRAEAVYFRNNPIITGTCAGKPPHDYNYFRCPVRAALIWNILEKAGIPEVKGVWCHEAGYSRAFTVVSIRQIYAGQDTMAGHVACQCRPGAVSGRFVVVVDDDIDPSNLDEVVWAMCSRCDPVTGLDIVNQTVGTPVDALSQVEPGQNFLELTSNRGIFFATKPFKKLHRGQFPRVVEADKATMQKVLERYSKILTAKGP